MHVLGLKWDHNNDTQHHHEKFNTRLGLKSCVKVYDTIGLVAPFTVGARLILKDIWRVNGQS